MSVTREFQVNPGLHTITATAEGYYTQQRTVDVQQDMTVTMTLQPISANNNSSSFSPTMLIAGAAMIVAVLLIVVVANSGDAREDTNYV